MSFIQQLRKHLEKDRKKTTPGFGSVEFGISELPKIVEKRNQDWVLWGEDNLYPNHISELKYGSPIHGAIIKTASDMISGEGFLINGSKTKEESEGVYNSLDANTKAAYDQFLKNPNNHPIEKIKARLALDLKEQGAYAYEVVFSHDFKTIATVKYVDVKNIRAGKMENDEVSCYWYSRDWSQSRLTEYKPKKISAFKPGNKESLNQLVYEKIGSLEYYGEPDYVQALTWVQTDCQMGIFHLSNIENGMNPSMKIQFYQKPENQEEEDEIMRNIRKKFVGPKRTGKHMVFFSNGKELAPDVSPVQTSNLDKQLILLAELCDKKILTGHKLTSPLLAGISVSGQIGGNTELEKAYQIYDKTRIAPYRNMIADSFQSILDYNKIGVKIRINPFNPFING